MLNATSVRAVVLPVRHQCVHWSKSKEENTIIDRYCAREKFSVLVVFCCFLIPPLDLMTGFYRAAFALVRNFIQCIANELTRNDTWHCWACHINVPLLDKGDGSFAPCGCENNNPPLPPLPTHTHTFLPMSRMALMGSGRWVGTMLGSMKTVWSHMCVLVCFWVLNIYTTWLKFVVGTPSFIRCTWMHHVENTGKDCEDYCCGLCASLLSLDIVLC